MGRNARGAIGWPSPVWRCGSGVSRRGRWALLLRAIGGVDFPQNGRDVLQGLRIDLRRRLDPMPFGGVRSLEPVGHVERLEPDGLQPRILRRAEAEVMGMDRKQL